MIDEAIERMKIVGIQESFIDYPDEYSIVLFSGTCSWNCRGCFNKYRLQGEKAKSREEIDRYLKESEGLVKHLVFSGGESMEQECAEEVIRYYKGLGYEIKLDSNGSRPDRIKSVLKYLSVVAMDVKEIPELSRYRRIVGEKFSEEELKRVKESMRILSDWYREDKRDRKLIYRTTKFDREIDSKAIERYLKEEGLEYWRYTVQEYQEIE